MGSEIRAIFERWRSHFRRHLELDGSTRGDCEALNAFFEATEPVLCRLATAGADIGFVLWLLAKIAFSRRIPPASTGPASVFWKKSVERLEAALETMQAFQPYFFSRGCLEELEKGIEGMKRSRPRLLIYDSPEESFQGAERAGKGRKVEGLVSYVAYCLASYLRDTTGGPRYNDIAKLLNACALEGFPKGHFDARRVERRTKDYERRAGSTWASRLFATERTRFFEVRPELERMIATGTGLSLEDSSEAPGGPVGVSDGVDKPTAGNSPAGPGLDG